MDLRPTRIREMAEAVYDNMVAKGILEDDPETRESIIEEWIQIMLPLWTSRSIPFPDDNWVCTYNEKVVQAFIAKYPRLQELIDLCRDEALRRWPEATFHFKIMSDPEGCHCCREAQSLIMEIWTDLDFYGPNGEEYPENSPYYAADEEWLHWLGDTSFRVLAEDIGNDVVNLFRADLQWKPDSES